MSDFKRERSDLSKLMAHLKVLQGQALSLHFRQVFASGHAINLFPSISFSHFSQIPYFPFAIFSKAAFTSFNFNSRLCSTESRLSYSWTSSASSSMLPFSRFGYIVSQSPLGESSFLAKLSSSIVRDFFSFSNLFFNSLISSFFI